MLWGYDPLLSGEVGMKHLKPLSPTRQIILGFVHVYCSLCSRGYSLEQLETTTNVEGLRNVDCLILVTCLGM